MHYLMQFLDQRGEFYLASYDVDAFNGGGSVHYTPDPDKAMRFPDAGAVLVAWRTQSTVRPFRLDGKPNRPLTALTMTTTKVET